MATTCKCLRWAFRLPDWEPTRAEWFQVLQSIQEEEVTRVNRFMFRDDTKSAAIGRIVMRASLARLLNVSWSQIRFGRSQKGKPLLTSPVGIERCPSFNVSHQGDYVVLATDCGSACGVDVMKIEFRASRLQETVAGYLDLMKRQFSHSEWTTMERASSDREKLTLFYRYWCLKESYIKATGEGIHNDLASIDFRFDNDDWSTFKPSLWLQDRCLSDQWHFTEYTLDSDHIAAVCTATTAESYCKRRTGDKFFFENMSISDLLKDAESLHSVADNSYDIFTAKSYKSK